MTNIREAVAQVRKSRQNGGTDSQFVSGDVAAGCVRAVTVEDKNEDGDEPTETATKREGDR